MSTDSPRGYPLPDGGDPMRGDSLDNVRTDVVALGMSIDQDVSELEQATDERITEVEDTASTAHRVANSPFEGALGDQDGRPSWVQYDGQGLPTPGVVDGLYSAGVPHVDTDGEDGFQLTGDDGAPSWLSTGPDGRPDLTAVTAIANAIHYYAGPTRPYVYPGNFIIWVQTAEDGTPLQTLIGRN